MDEFSPEFVTHWLADAGDDAVAGTEEPGTTEDEALAELAERVLAARSIV